MDGFIALAFTHVFFQRQSECAETFLDGATQLLRREVSDYVWCIRSLVTCTRLAWFEVRQIIALTFFNFDLELHSSSEKWLEDQVSYLLWARTPLMVNIKPATV
jgi:hypothetical protein